MKNAVQSSAFHLGDICMKLMIKKEKVEIRREKKKRNEKDYEVHLENTSAAFRHFKERKNKLASSKLR